jgi:hypothetical protein
VSLCPSCGEDGCPEAFPQPALEVALGGTDDRWTAAPTHLCMLTSSVVLRLDGCAVLLAAGDLMPVVVGCGGRQKADRWMRLNEPAHYRTTVRFEPPDMRIRISDEWFARTALLPAWV